MWFKPGATSELSVEEGIANTLGIHMGDTLTYDVAGTKFSAKVTSLRKVEWDSMQVNFFVIAAPGMLEDFPASYITSFHLPPDKAQAANALIKSFPNLLLIDVEEMIEQVRHIMDQIAQTMSAVFLFTLLSGMAVLYAALLATQDERIHEAAILRTLGADSRYLRQLAPERIRHAGRIERTVRGRRRFIAGLGAGVQGAGHPLSAGSRSGWRGSAAGLRS